MNKQIIKLGIFLCILLSHMQHCSEKEDAFLRNVKGDCVEPFSLSRSESQTLLKIHNVVTNSVLYPEVEEESDFFIGFDLDEENEVKEFTCEKNTMSSVLQECSGCDIDIMTYWTRPSRLSRMEMHAKSLKILVRTIFCDVVKLDDVLQKNKNKIKEELCEQSVKKIMQDLHMSYEKKISMIKEMQDNNETLKERLWLQYMYESRDLIHKNVEKRKVLNSHCAWPYIKEIGRIRKFPQWR